MKSTKARNFILNILSKSNSPLTALDIFKKVENENINLSTVYRSLNTFVSNKIVKKEVSNLDKITYYSLVDKKKHYHILECTNCHKQIRIDYCPFESVEKKIYKDYGFKVEDENSIVYGVCKDCLNKSK